MRHLPLSFLALWLWPSCTPSDPTAPTTPSTPSTPEAPQPPFEVQDLVISDPSDNLSDPEFDARTMRFTWTLRGDLWVGDIDPATGDLFPPDGLGEKIDTELVPLIWGNGPEWMQTDRGSELIYTRHIGTRTHIYRAWEEASGWQPLAIEDGGGRMHPFGSADPGDTEGRILYVDPSTFTMYWRYLDGPEQLLTTERLEFAARWVDGTHKMIYASPTSEGRQVFLHDVGTDTREQLTFPPGSHGDTFMWTDPGLQELIFFATLDDEQGRPTSIGVFRRIDGSWQLVQEIRPPDDLPYVISPEPFVSGGHSYVAYAVSDAPLNVDHGDAEIWLAGLLDAESVHRRISDDAPGIRLDPEPLVTAQGAWVYYSAPDPLTGVWLLRRCATGL